MAVYSYIAKDAQGNQFAGTYRDIETVSALRQELSKIGYTLVQASQAGDRQATPGPFRRIPEKDVVAFAYQLASMYSAGLTVLQCLRNIEDQTGHPALRAVLSDIGQSIETGSSLKKAFDRHAEVFSHFFVGMVGAGEAGGKLAESLDRVAEYLEKRQELRHKIKSAFTYPAIVGVVCVIVVTCMLIFVVPMFSRLYARLHVALPGPTQFLILLSGALCRWWMPIAAAVFGLTVCIRRLLRTPALRAWLDDARLRMPVLGRVNRLIVVSRFTRTFAALVSVGVPLIEAIEVAQTVVHNSRMSRIARDLQESIRAGRPVAGSLKDHDLFPAVVVQMADSGEQAGMLAEMLTKAADFLDRDINRRVARLVVKVEPALTLAMGLLIGLILLGVYMPMFDYMGHLK